VAEPVIHEWKFAGNVGDHVEHHAAAG
jgi:hypothetical protein